MVSKIGFTKVYKADVRPWLCCADVHACLDVAVRPSGLLYDRRYVYLSQWISPFAHTVRLYMTVGTFILASVHIRDATNHNCY